MPITSINKPVDPAERRARRGNKFLFPAPDDRRCEAIATGTGDRCSSFAFWWCRRDGRQVCTHHFRAPSIKYADGCGDRVGAYRDAMAKALGDAA
jgi:hypothetical protein